MLPKTIGSQIVMRGKPWTVPFPVHTWEVTHCKWEGRARASTRAVVVHWTGAENAALDVFANMSMNKCSVHFVIDARGTIWQFADTMLEAAHCKAYHANQWSIGIEFVGRGSALKAAQRGVLRQRVLDHIHGREVYYDNLLPRQIEQGVRLVRTLCTLHNLPFRVAEDPFGGVLSTAMSKEVADDFSGVCGHLNLSPLKVDPGMRLLRAIQEAASDTSA